MLSTSRQPYSPSRSLDSKIIVQHMQGEVRVWGDVPRAVLSVQVFPLTQRHGSELKKAAQAVHEQTDRDDVRTMANMYSNNLESEMKRTGRLAAVLEFCDRQSLALMASITVTRSIRLANSMAA